MAVTFQPLEAVSHYRQSKNKRQAIEVIADANLMTKTAVIDMLLANGVRQVELPRATRNLPPVTENQTEEAAGTPEVAPAAQAEPANNYREQVASKLDTVLQYAQAARQRIDDLKRRRQDIDAEIEALESKMNLIRMAVMPDE